MAKRVIILNSGGPDSAMLAKKLHDDGFDVVSVFVDTGQINSASTALAAAATADLYCVKHIVHSEAYGQTSNYFYNAQTGDFKMFDEAPEMEADYWENGYVLGPTPNHTMTFIGAGIAYAIAEGAKEVYLGLKSDVYQDADWAKVSDLIPESGWTIPRVAVLAPLRELEDQTYAGVAAYAVADITDFAYTHSCIHAVPCADAGRALCFKCLPRSEQGL